jgi:hypothetical protein
MATFYLGQARSAASAPRIRALASASIEWASSLLKANLGSRDLGPLGLNPQLLADIGEMAGFRCLRIGGGRLGERSRGRTVGPVFAQCQISSIAIADDSVMSPRPAHPAPTSSPGGPVGADCASRQSRLSYPIWAYQAAIRDDPFTSTPAAKTPGSKRPLWADSAPSL